MSGVGFFELVILFMIGLVVLGPQRLPKEGRLSPSVFNRPGRRPDTVISKKEKSMKTKEKKKKAGKEEQQRLLS